MARSTTGFCKIEVRFKKVVGSERITKGNIPFVGDLTAYHAYIITQDAQSGTYYFRSGPECGGAGSGSGSSNSGHRNYGSSNSGNCNVGSSNSGNNNVGSSNGGAHHRGGSGSGGGLFGYIYAQGGLYTKTSPDYTTNSVPFMSIINDSTLCSYYNGKFAALVQRLNNAHIDYNPLTTNSNATAHELLNKAGLGSHTSWLTPVWAPGWLTSLNF